MAQECSTGCIFSAPRAVQFQGRRLDTGGDDQCKRRQRWEIRRLGYIVETNEHYRQRTLLRYAPESAGSA